MTGCRAGSPTVGSPSPASTPTRADAGPTDTLAVLTAAVGAGDRAGFLAATADQDGFGATANLIWSNLAALALTSFSWELTGVEGPLTTARRQRLGPGARLRQTRVGWAVPGDRWLAEQRLWATFVPDGTGWRLAALTDRPADTGTGTGTDTDTAEPVPLWLLQPISRVAAGDGSVLGQAPGAWASIVSRSVAAVAERVPPALRPDWNEALVVLLPGNDQLAARTLGADPGATSTIAATAFPDGDDADRAPLRVLVRPGEVAGLPTLGRDVLMTHEAVHVATGSPRSRAPLWLVEGYADWVAYDRWPVAAPSALAPLLQRVRAGTGPSRLPTDDDFSGTDLDLPYTAAWTACRYVVARYGADRMADLYRAGPDGTAEAVRQALGRSEAEFTRDWLGALERQASG